MKLIFGSEYLKILIRKFHLLFPGNLLRKVQLISQTWMARIRAVPMVFWIFNEDLNPNFNWVCIAVMYFQFELINDGFETAMFYQLFCVIPKFHGLKLTNTQSISIAKTCLRENQTFNYFMIICLTVMNNWYNVFI